MSTLQQALGGFKILDGYKLRTPASSAELEKFLRSKKWIIGRTEIAEFMSVSTVSTVFLKLEHHGGMWFETMIFGGKHDEFCTRYKTRSEAEAGHTMIVAALQAGRDPETTVQS